MACALLDQLAPLRCLVCDAQINQRAKQRQDRLSSRNKDFTDMFRIQKSWPTLPHARKEKGKEKKFMYYKKYTSCFQTLLKYLHFQYIQKATGLILNPSKRTLKPTENRQKHSKDVMLTRLRQINWCMSNNKNSRLTEAFFFFQRDGQSLAPSAYEGWVKQFIHQIKTSTNQQWDLVCDCLASTELNLAKEWTALELL